ncbi:MAG: hypothetical protein KGK34_07245 [Chloroflexota bacterium]|nr:hypothetical protein [Chloroflexota bacterium]
MSEVSQAKSFARNPVRAAEKSPVAAGVLVTAGLLAVAYARGQRQIGKRQVLSAALGAGAFVVSAKVLPQPVAWIVLAALAYVTFTTPDGLATFLAPYLARVGLSL